MDRSEMEVKHIENGVEKRYRFALLKKITDVRRSDVYKALHVKGLFESALSKEHAFIMNDERYDFVIIRDDDFQLQIKPTTESVIKPPTESLIIFILITDEPISSSSHCETLPSGIEAMKIN